MKTAVNTLIVNLFGAPSSGKSTAAAFIFAQLKMAGLDCELVTEFAKDKTWEENWSSLKNQAYIFGKQYRRMERVWGKVDVIITDSPLMTSIVYNDRPELGEPFQDMIMDVHNNYNNMNFLLFRNTYEKGEGRTQDQSAAREIHNKILQMLAHFEVDYDILEGTKESCEEIVDAILGELGIKEDK